MKRRTGETFLPNLIVQISQDENQNKKEIHLKKKIDRKSNQSRGGQNIT
jgi:hypothetical protein